jgi:NAD(P)-dependent dehydrogenase (short-subunit alcohol dehydrogenase family)
MKFSGKVGRLDILINTAGGFEAGTRLWDSDPATLDRMLALNLQPGFLLARRGKDHASPGNRRDRQRDCQSRIRVAEHHRYQSQPDSVSRERRRQSRSRSLNTDLWQLLKTR